MKKSIFTLILKELNTDLLLQIQLENSSKMKRSAKPERFRIEKTIEKHLANEITSLVDDERSKIRSIKKDLSTESKEEQIEWEKNQVK